jgi:hypothetical protein
MCCGIRASKTLWSAVIPTLGDRTGYDVIMSAVKERFMFRHSSLHIASRGPRIALISAYNTWCIGGLPSRACSIVSTSAAKKQKQVCTVERDPSVLLLPDARGPS